VLVVSVEKFKFVYEIVLCWKLVVTMVLADSVDPTIVEAFTVFAVNTLVHVSALLAPEVNT